MKIKIFPETGDAYVVELPDSVAQANNVERAINTWVDENLRNVQFWDYCK